MIVLILKPQKQVKIAKTQYNRSVNLNKEGFKTNDRCGGKTHEITKKRKAKIITQENKYITSKNEVLNAQWNLTELAPNMQKKHKSKQR